MSNPLRKVFAEELYFLNATEEISTTGHRPKRGFYRLVYTEGNLHSFWVDVNYKEIPSEWQEQLDKFYEEDGDKL